MRHAVVFPDQSSWRPAAGRKWKTDPSWRMVEQAEAVLKRPIADSLLSEETPADVDLLHVSVLLTSLMNWESVRGELGDPVAFAGHSLGQITALVAAGSLDLSDAVELVSQRARHLDDASRANPGLSLGVTGRDGNDVGRMCEAVTDPCWVSYDNGSEVVVGGTASAIAELADHLDGDDTVGNVRPADEWAMHTPMMAVAALAIRMELEEVDFATPRVPVICAGSTQVVRDGTGWRQRLALQVTKPVRWRETMQRLAGMADRVVADGSDLAEMSRASAPWITVDEVVAR